MPFHLPRVTKALLIANILGFVLQNDPELQEAILQTAMAQIPVIGSQIRAQELAAEFGR